MGELGGKWVAPKVRRVTYGCTEGSSSSSVVLKRDGGEERDMEARRGVWATNNQPAEQHSDRRADRKQPPSSRPSFHTSTCTKKGNLSLCLFKANFA